METCNYDVRYPDNINQLDQDEEFITLVTGDGQERIRLHDYGRLYEVPGLYERVIYDRLKCDSPRVVCSILSEEMEKDGGADDLRVLDFGAGNGIVGRMLKDDLGCDPVVGLDIIPQARDAADRDHPEVYDEYYVMDLSQPGDEETDHLSQWDFNGLVTVAALGYGDIPAQAFLNAFNLVDDGGWVAFNIKERFLSDEDETGYRDTLDLMMGDSFYLHQSKRYCHRLALCGEPLHYHAIVGRKIKDVPLNS